MNRPEKHIASLPTTSNWRRRALPEFTNSAGRSKSSLKWIKQNLKIKSFLGTSENAVMTQIYVAIIHYLLVAYIKFLHGFKLSLTELTNRIRDTLMQNLSLLEILALNRKTITKPPDWNSPEQLENFSKFPC